MTTTTTMAPKRVGISQVARQLGMTKTAVRELVRLGELQEISMPVPVRATILASSVDAFIARTYGDRSQAS